VLDSFSLDGRVALVTGGGRGLGRGMALGLAAAGAHVVVASRSADELDDTAKAVAAAGGTCDAVTADLASDDGPARLVDDVVARAGQLDVCVHAAGNQVRRPALEMTAEDWDAVHRLHLRSAFLLAQATARHLVARGAPGSVVLVGSLTSFRGFPDIAAYGAAKTGILGLVRTLAVEWAESGIRVNALAPGFYPTEMTRDLDRHPGRQALIARTPMGRTGTPDDLAGPAVFLASDASAYVTGQCLTVDGGWTAA